MEVPITQFRRDVFDLVNRALQGEDVWITYKNQRLRIVPEVSPATRFDRLTRIQDLNPANLELDDAAMKAEMQTEWEKDWLEEGLSRPGHGPSKP